MLFAEFRPTRLARNSHTSDAGKTGCVAKAISVWLGTVKKASRRLYERSFLDRRRTMPQSKAPLKKIKLPGSGTAVILLMKSPYALERAPTDTTVGLAVTIRKNR